MLHAAGARYVTLSGLFDRRATCTDFDCRPISSDNALLLSVPQR